MASMLRKLIRRLSRPFLTAQPGMTGIEIAIAMAAIGLIVPVVTGGTAMVLESRERSQDLQYEISLADKALLRPEMAKVFDQYPASKYCFMRVSSLGDREKWFSTFDKLHFVVNPHKTGDRKAAYVNGIIYLSAPPAELAANSKHLSDLPVTLWHEIAHAIEVDNGDRSAWRAVFSTRDGYMSRNERHTEYMEAMLAVAQRLKIFEQGVNGKKDPALLKQHWQAIEKAYGEGSYNNFEKVPSDMSEFSGYTGYKFDLAGIKAMYAAGTCLKVPPGVLDDETSTAEQGQPATEQPKTEEWVIWIGENATGVGINITTREQFEKSDLARDYPGGGLDPKLVLVKRQFVNQTFSSFDEAEEWMCSNLTDVRVWPLATGWHGVYTDGVAYPLGNFDCQKEK